MHGAPRTSSPVYTLLLAPHPLPHSHTPHLQKARWQPRLPCCLLQKGSLFLVDYSLLAGVRTNVINGRPQFSTAPMTLLYQRPGRGPLLPLAIQVSSQRVAGQGWGVV